MPAPSRNAVPTGRVVFTLPVKGPNIESVIQVTVQPRGTVIPETHWNLVDLVWTGVKQWAQNLAAFPNHLVTQVSVQRSYDYTVAEGVPHPDDFITTKNITTEQEAGMVTETESLS